MEPRRFPLLRVRLRRSVPACIGLSMLLGVAAPADTPRSSSARNLVLITADTWRNDHFDQTRAGVELTPRLSRFAADAMRFRDASSVSTETSPGIASILTGLYPHRNGVVRNDHILAKRVPSLAPMLSERGFATAAFVANAVLAPRHGFGAGFEHYALLSTTRRHVDGRATKVTAAALEWLDARPREAPFFVWLHYMDPHGPYEPEHAHRSLFPLSGFGAKRTAPLLPAGQNSGFRGIPYYQHEVFAPPVRDVRDYLARYAAEVRAMDHGVGLFLDALRKRELLDSTLVFVTSDHGEALEKDHGFYFSHAHGPTQDQIRVPLLLRNPTGPKGAVIDRPVSTLDVAATALALLALPAADDMDGRSLLDTRPRGIMSQTANAMVYRQGRWKLWRQRHQGLWLFDLSENPAEQEDRSLEAPEELKRLRAGMSRALAPAALVEPRSRAGLTPEEEEMLKALGYL